MARLWIAGCRFIARVFYRQVEVKGTEHFPAQGPVLLCANHANALADFVLLQSSLPRLLHPLARSGLFRQPVLGSLLRAIEAVPVHRRDDPDADPRKNRDAFEQCYDLLRRGAALVIFPEGVSHSAPSTKPLRTGAARLALGSLLRGGPLPVLVPAGLTFVEKGTFRSRVLLQFGAPLAISTLTRSLLGTTAGENAGPAEPPPAVVRELTDLLDRAIGELTLSSESWEDLALLRQLERFFHFRRGRRPSSSPLSHRFRTFKRLIAAHRRLRAAAPSELRALRRKLIWFERLRRLYGIDDYHLRMRFTPGLVLGAVARSLIVLALLLPFAVFGAATSGLPYLLTRVVAPRLAARSDQWDTSKILLGFPLFLLVWSAEIFLVWRGFGTWPALLFAVALPLGGAVALSLLRWRSRVGEWTRAFLLFRRRRDLQEYLLSRRQEIEGDLARLVLLAKSTFGG